MGLALGACAGLLAGIGSIPEAQAVSVETAAIEIRARVDILLYHLGDDLLLLGALQLRLQVLALNGGGSLGGLALSDDCLGQLLERSLVALSQELVVMGLGALLAARVAAQIRGHDHSEQHDAGDDQRALAAGQDESLDVGHGQASRVEAGTAAISGGDSVPSRGTSAGQR